MIAMEKRICQQCNKKELKKHQRKYCSKKCEGESRTKWISKTCYFCKKEFKLKPQRINKAKFCSHECYWKFLIGKPSGTKGRKLSEQQRRIIAKRSPFQKGHTPWNKGKPHLRKEKHPLWGKHHSEETRKKMSEAKNRLYKSGWKVWNYGKHFSEETKEKIRKARANQKNIPRGENHYFWKGGISPLKRRLATCFRRREWRRAVFERDKFTCQQCGVRGGYLEADHIVPLYIILKENKITTFEEAMRYEPLWNVNNGRTLCRFCHNKTETWGRH